MSQTKEKSLKRDVDWLCVIYNIQLVISTVFALHFIISDAYLLTSIFCITLIVLGTLGTTAGSHRLWAHHSYEASRSLKIVLMLCQTLSGHTTIFNWVQLHRLHHKFYQTDLDPYNPKRGFIYSHFVTNNLKLSSEQESKLKEIDMSDLENDKVVMFQKKYYWIMYVIIALLLPINAPAEYWGESILNSTFILGWFRIAVNYHLNLLIHSATTVFDLNTDERNAFESNMVFLINKSYWLSYHYLSPWDYQTGEYGKYGTDCTSKFIRVCAALELAFGLKTVDSNVVRDALMMAVKENKPISTCLYTVSQNSNKASEEHFLNPSKYYK